MQQDKSVPGDVDAGAAAVLERGCSSPVRTALGTWVRCGSRIKSRCASCAELYRNDWAAIGRSGVFPAAEGRYRFYLLTLTAPSFGRVHRVPKSEGESVERCGCGLLHTAGDAFRRGVPLDVEAYDYEGQVAWNRDAGLLWDRTRRRVRDRWGSLEYFIVREWQDRGVLHVHALVRIARAEAPSPDELRDAARSASAVSKVDGTVVEWGERADCKAFRADGDGAKTIWYLSKALNYVLKDVATGADEVPVDVWRHQMRLADAARRMRCRVGCDPQNCGSLVHQRFGSRSQVVSQSRPGRGREGWSLTGLTRTVQRRLRLEWVLARAAARAEADAAPCGDVAAVEGCADRARRELVSRAAVVP